MSRVKALCEQWQDVRNGLIREVEQIPDEQMGFKPAAESRAVIELLHHIIESEKVLAGEICRGNTNFGRGFPALIADFAGNVKEATTKDTVLELLRSSFEETKAMVIGFGDANLEKMMTRFDGKQCKKFEMLDFTVAHEMYHRGQLTVYERLLGIEPALTQFFRKMMSASS
jgi:uncharacterized damage-inducible protein DinB